MTISGWPVLPADGWLVMGPGVVVKATLVLSAAWLVSWLLRRRPAAERHALWAVTAAGVLALPLLVAALPSMRLAVPLPDGVATALRPEAIWGHETTREAPPRAANPQPTAASPTGNAAGDATRAATAASAAGVAAPRAPAESAPRAMSGAAVFLFWLVGALALTALTLLSRLRVELLARRARTVRAGALHERVARCAAELRVTRPVRLLAGDAAAMPMTFGVLRPSLLLPSSAAEWTPARLDAVLRHELAHIRRRDALTQLVAELCCAVYWFHPLAWLAARRLRAEREHACDDVVLMAGARASDYAAELLAIARTMRQPPVLEHGALAMARTTKLRRRLSALLDDRRRVERVPATLLTAYAGAAAACVMLLAAAAPVPRAAFALPVYASELAQPAGSGRLQAAPPTPPAPAVHSAEHTAPPAPAASASAMVQERACWRNAARAVDGTIIIWRDSKQHHTQNSIERTTDGVSMCMRWQEPITFAGDGSAVRFMSDEAWLVLATRDERHARSLEITPGPTGDVHVWRVDGVVRPFDDEARAWRDALLPVLHLSSETHRVRGEATSLRGRITSLRGKETSLRGQITSLRGRETSLRGQIASVRGQEASLRAQLSALRARDAHAADTTRRIRELEEWIRANDTEARVDDLEARIAALETAARVQEIEARIAALDVAGGVRAIEREIEVLDADRQVAELKAGIEPAERRLRDVLNRMR
jgi:beta-lactamase regulating signal transducer with metallopeptidase domain